MDVSYCIVGLIVGVEFGKLFVCDWCDLYGGNLLLWDCDVLVVRERECFRDWGIEVK